MKKVIKFTAKQNYRFFARLLICVLLVVFTGVSFISCNSNPVVLYEGLRFITPIGNYNLFFFFDSHNLNPDELKILSGEKADLETKFTEMYEHSYGFIFDEDEIEDRFSVIDDELKEWVNQEHITNIDRVEILLKLNKDGSVVAAKTDGIDVCIIRIKKK